MDAPLKQTKQYHDAVVRRERVVRRRIPASSLIAAMNDARGTIEVESYEPSNPELRQQEKQAADPRTSARDAIRALVILCRGQGYTLEDLVTAWLSTD